MMKSIITVNKNGQLEAWLDEENSMILNGLDEWFDTIIWTL